MTLYYTKAGGWHDAGHAADGGRAAAGSEPVAAVKCGDEEKGWGGGQGSREGGGNIESKHEDRGFRVGV